MQSWLNKAAQVANAAMESVESEVTSHASTDPAAAAAHTPSAPSTPAASAWFQQAAELASQTTSSIKAFSSTVGGEMELREEMARREAEVEEEVARLRQELAQARAQLAEPAAAADSGDGGAREARDVLERELAESRSDAKALEEKNARLRGLLQRMDDAKGQLEARLKGSSPLLAGADMRSPRSASFERAFEGGVNEALLGTFSCCDWRSSPFASAGAPWTTGW